MANLNVRNPICASTNAGAMFAEKLSQCLVECIFELQGLDLGKFMEEFCNAGSVRFNIADVQEIWVRFSLFLAEE